MSAAEFIQKLEAMPESERERVFASLVENQEWREDLLDLMNIAERRDEPTRPIDEVFKDLKIDA
jgi:L-rhamnose mutarotase